MNLLGWPEWGELYGNVRGWWKKAGGGLEAGCCMCVRVGGKGVGSWLYFYLVHCPPPSKSWKAGLLTADEFAKCLQPEYVFFSLLPLHLF